MAHCTFVRFDHADGRAGSYMAHLRTGKPIHTCVAPDFDDPSKRCARLSVALCDFPIPRAAWQAAGADPAGGAWTAGVSSHGKTCDAPICERHRRQVDPNRDYCPRHDVDVPTQEDLPL